MVETVIQLAAEKLEPKESTQTVVDNLMPRTVYSFNVSAYFLDSEAWGRSRRIDVETLSDGKHIRGTVFPDFYASARRGFDNRQLLFTVKW